MNNKTLLVSSAVLASAIFSQGAFAETLSKESLINSSQGYTLDYSEQAQPRRSALFAMLLDQLANRATLAKLESSTNDNAVVLNSSVNDNAAMPASES